MLKVTTEFSQWKQKWHRHFSPAMHHWWCCELKEKLKLRPFHQTIYRNNWSLYHTLKRLVSIQQERRKDSFWPFQSLPQVSTFRKVKFASHLKCNSHMNSLKQWEKSLIHQSQDSLDGRDWYMSEKARRSPSLLYIIIFYNMCQRQTDFILHISPGTMLMSHINILVTYFKSYTSNRSLNWMLRGTKY